MRRRVLNVDVGEFVLLETHVLSSKGKKVVGKFAPKYEGPYKVLRIKDNNLLLDIKGESQWVNIDQIRVYKARGDSISSGSSTLSARETARSPSRSQSPVNEYHDNDSATLTASEGHSLSVSPSSRQEQSPYSDSEVTEKQSTVKPVVETVPKQTVKNYFKTGYQQKSGTVPKACDASPSSKDSSNYCNKNRRQNQGRSMSNPSSKSVDKAHRQNQGRSMLNSSSNSSNDLQHRNQGHLVSSPSSNFVNKRYHRNQGHVVSSSSKSNNISHRQGQKRPVSSSNSSAPKPSQKQRRYREPLKRDRQMLTESNNSGPIYKQRRWREPLKRSRQMSTKSRSTNPITKKARWSDPRKRPRQASTTATPMPAWKRAKFSHQHPYQTRLKTKMAASFRDDEERQFTEQFWSCEKTQSPSIQMSANASSL